MIQTKKSQHRAQRTAFFLWNKTSDIFLLIIFICACVIVHVYVISLTVRHAIDVLDTWKYHSPSLFLSVSLARIVWNRFVLVRAARERKFVFIAFHLLCLIFSQRRKEHFFLLHKMNGRFFLSLIPLLSFVSCIVVVFISFVDFFVLLAFRLAHQSYLFM